MKVHKPTKITRYGSAEWGVADERVYENINDHCNNFEFFNNSVPNSAWFISVAMGQISHHNALPTNHKTT